MLVQVRGLENGASQQPNTYSHPRLIQLIQQRQPEYDDALDAVQDAQTLVRDMKHTLAQAEQQLTQAQLQLQRTIPAQQAHCQLVRELQATQHACWNRSLSAELSGLILGKTSRYNVIMRMVAVSCPLLRLPARHNERCGADQVRVFAVVTSAGRSWLCSHVVR